MRRTLAGTVAAVTGASAGIGRATALELAARGATVALTARRADRLSELAAEITAAGGRALAVPGDVASERDMTAFVEQTVAAFGRLDVMVCNAGIGYHGRFDETSTAAMRRLVEVNLMGTLYSAHAAVAVMRRQQAGHLIVISSIVGRRGVGGSSVYSATKAAQVALVESLRAEFAGTPLKASVVFPVSTVTEFHDAIARDFGHAVAGKGPRQPAERVARAIADCIESPRPEVYPYWPAKLLSVVSVAWPSLADRLIQRFGRRRVPHPGPSSDAHGDPHS